MVPVQDAFVSPMPPVTGATGATAADPGPGLVTLTGTVGGRQSEEGGCVAWVARSPEIIGREIRGPPRNSVFSVDKTPWMATWMGPHGWGCMDGAAWMGPHGWGRMDGAAWMGPHGWGHMDGCQGGAWSARIHV
eukprot:338455-Chlamydomonas_euryale.AAC.1